MRKVGINLDEDFKKMIIEGDIEMLSEVVKDIYNLKESKLEIKNEEESKVEYDDTIDIYHLNTNKAVNLCNNYLEFIVVVLSQELKMSAKQSALLLANHNKLLNSMLIKGQKQVAGILQKVYTNLKTVINFSKLQNSTIH